MLDSFIYACMTCPVTVGSMCLQHNIIVRQLLGVHECLGRPAVGR